MLKRTRQILGLAYFIGITLLLLDVSGLLHRQLGWMPKWQLLPALLALNALVVVALIALTLIFGRLYCSVICPLGVYQDLVARLGRWKRKNPYNYSKPLTWLRWGTLAIFVGFTVAGLTSLAALIAPYSSYGRMVTHLLQPLWTAGNNALAAIAESADSYAISQSDFVFYGLPALIVAGLTFVLVSLLAWRNGRTWCNTICPVGTVLGFLSRFSIFKVRLDSSKCKGCSLCARNCKASCIDYKAHTIDHSRCVACGNCLSKCKHGALTYSPGLPLNDTKHTGSSEGQNATDAGRRSFLISSGLLATAALAQEKKKVDGGLAVIEKKKSPQRQTPITPPGSLSARHLQQHCTTCQLCISECPNKVLRPSTDLSHFLQPVMGYEHGFCRPECSRCSHVCPTGAIREIIPSDKSAIQLGHAVWIKQNCLPLTDGVTCGNCARHCPTGAISMIPYDANDEQSPKVPAVNTEVCIGCGACEYLCPARPFPAIYVEGHEVHRYI